MKTTESPTTNESAERNRPPFGCWPCRSCSTPIPLSIEIYPGTSGSTHGDKNETSPARNAAANETSGVMRQKLRKVFDEDTAAKVSWINVKDVSSGQTVFSHRTYFRRGADDSCQPNLAAGARSVPQQFL